MVRAERKQDRRVKKFRDVLSGWESGRLSQLEAADVLGCSERQFRRYVGRYEADGAEGLKDKRLGRAQSKAIPVDEVERMLNLYRTTYRGWNVSHFHDHGRRDHNFNWGYTWTKTQLHAAGLVVPSTTHGPHRRKRERKPWAGMMLHQDGSKHAWLDGQSALDLIVTMDDATSTIYSAFLVDEEGTASTFDGFIEVFATHGLPSSVYTDRGSHYFTTPEAGGPVDKVHKTQVGRALSTLGVEHIAAYSPEARGRSERMFGTLQDRLVKELHLAGITDVGIANSWIKATYLPDHNARFAKRAAHPESAFTLGTSPDQLRETLCVIEPRVVSKDNTVVYGRVRLQLPPSPGRAHYVKANVSVREYPDGRLAVFHGPRCLARFDSAGQLAPSIIPSIIPVAPRVAACSPPSRCGLPTAVPASPPACRPTLTASARAAKGLPSRKGSTGAAEPPRLV